MVMVMAVMVVMAVIAAMVAVVMVVLAAMVARQVSKLKFLTTGCSTFISTNVLRFVSRIAICREGQPETEAAQSSICEQI